MAARTSAGTGVIVSLVVFVLVSVFLLVMTIVFYRGQTIAQEKQASAEKALDQYVRREERNTEWVKAASAAAAASVPSKSVIRYVNDQFQEGMGFLTGDPQSSLEVARPSLASQGVKEDKPAMALISDLKRDNNQLRTESDRRRQQLAESETEKVRLFEQLGQERTNHQQELTSATAKIEELRKEGERYRSDVQRTLDEFASARDAMQARFEGQMRDLNAEIDRLMQENAIFSSRIKEFERRMNEIRMKAADPSALVDGRVIDAAGTSDQVFIDRGRQHRIVLGMTFEVYDDEKSIRVNPMTGEQPRGKASLLVTKVGDTTSTCRITRAVPGRPVVRGDVVANAVYDPNYKFKFLVFGKFDVDGDGKSTDAEADYLRSRILEWGGTVVTGDSLPGDLDFLVLGEEPPLPTPPRANATDAEIRIWLERRQVRETYTRLLRQATDAQIPVLNANRFFILTGHAGQ